MRCALVTSLLASLACVACAPSAPIEVSRRGDSRPGGRDRAVIHGDEALEVHVDGRAVGRLPGVIALEPGHREVELRDVSTGRTVYQRELHLLEGDEIDARVLLSTRRRWKFDIAAGMWAPLSAPSRGYLLRPTRTFRFSLERTRAPIPRLSSQVYVSWAQGSGSVTSLEVPVTYLWSVLGLGGALSYELLDSGPWRLDLGLDVGAELSWRELDSTRETAPAEYTTMVHTDGVLRVEYAVTELWSLGLRLQSGALWLQPDTSLPQWTLRPTLGVGFTF